MRAFVARTSPLAEEANGWQAFFLDFLNFLATADYADGADMADLDVGIWTLGCLPLLPHDAL
jgi:hypothetical protein